MRLLKVTMAAALLLTGVAAAASAEAAAMQESGVAVNQDLLIGVWTDTNDCSNTVTFHRDGRFTLSAGGNGVWTLDGDRLTFQGVAGSRSARVQAPDRNTIRLIHPDGTIGGSTRCGAAPVAARRVAMPPLPATAAEVLRIGRTIGGSDLIGRWTDNGDCSNIIEFHRDGRFTLSGGGSGRWRLSGEQLTFIGESEVTARVRGVGRDRILLIHPDGSLGQSMRC